ncbi:MAG: peptidase and in kexin sedolisin [Actinomycetia bacterium]|nr:peptidase and in kexin sedolisin [Actinomycetes bacterium]
MRATWWMHRRKLAVVSVMAVAVAGLGAGAASPAAASDRPAQATAGPSVPANTVLSTAALDNTADSKLVKPTQRTGVVPHTVIAVLSGTSVTGRTLERGSTALAPKTSNAAVNTALSRVAATSIQPLFSGLSSGTAEALNAAAKQRIGGQALNLGDIVVVNVKGNAAAAATKLAATSGISFAEPDRYVETMDTGGQVLTSGSAPARLKAANVRAVTPGSSLLPANYGLESSLDSYLNAQGDDVGGAYATLQGKYGQLPGTGETITNISVGDLTDASMKDAEVATYGPTTLLQDGQRYIDLPTMPLIPAYVAEPDGSLSSTASVEGTGDPVLGEIGLDFSVMAPRPDGDQRAGDTGSGFTDLLGIAPGASYRLVVPATPTLSEIAQAFVAAVTQQSPPDVITASLGFGTDAQGFPSRYLEDDPLMETVIAAIVQQYGITVVDSANDGTRLYTPTAVGPDGGATPTNVARTPSDATTIDDDQYSTTPSQVIDSGSIDAGATTTDDTLAVPPQDGGNAWRNPTYTETRTDGSANFASGWGQRVTLSAPGDNIPAFEHSGPAADSVAVVLNGGTSASAPEIAAAAADVLQAARLTHQQYGPAQVIKILQQTGHAVATPPQADQPLNVGPQIDVTAAVDAVLRAGHASLPATSIVRLSVAHRVDINTTGAAFTEYTDPGQIDLQDPTAGSALGMKGAGATGPVTFAADITGPRGNNYALLVDGHRFTNTADYIRVTPAELLAAAGQPLESTSSRTLTVTYQVRQGGQVLAQASDTLTVGPYDGTSSVAPAPVVPRVITSGQSVKVSYNLTGASTVVDPKLVVSTAGHWNPTLGPVFNVAYSVSLSAATGTVTLPASAFGDGGGSYGIGIEQDSGSSLYGDFAPVRVTGFPAGFAAVARPSAPLLATAGTAAGHDIAVDRADPDFTLTWNVGPRAAGAILEISAPAPTLDGSYNTFSNPNGTQRDSDGYDAGSVVYQKLPAAAGSRTFSALALGLPTSLSYDVRILPTSQSGAVAGQASPMSLLEVDDGLAPNGDIVGNFAMAGADSVVSIAGPDGSQVVNYDPATGTYGSVIASDASGGQFYIFGVDPSAHTVLVDDVTTGSDGTRTDDVGLYDTQTGTLVGAPDLSGYTLKGGVVDAARDRANLLADASSSRDDTVIAVSMLTGTVTTATDADGGTVPAGSLANIVTDAATGEVYAAAGPGSLLCFGGATSLAEVNPGTGTVTDTTGGTHCDVDLAVDSAAGNLLSVNYRAVSVNFAGTSSLVVMPEANPAADSVYPLRTGAPVELAADPVHHLALVLYALPAGPAKFGAPGGIAVTDSNAMSVIDVIDTSTGDVVKTIGDFNSPSVNGYPFATNPGIQLDPATRTGYMFAPGDDQVQQFSY